MPPASRRVRTALPPAAANRFPADLRPSLPENETRSMAENKNLLLAIVLSLAILFGFQAYIQWKYPQASEDQAQAPATERTVPGQPGVPAIDAPPDLARPSASPTGEPAVAPSAAPTVGTEAAPGRSRGRTEVLAETPRVRIETPRLKGSISLVGARFDDLTLTNHRQTLDPASPPVTLLAPMGAPDTYFVEMGWDDARAGIPMPGNTTEWSADRDVLTQDTPVTLTWDNGAGLRFERTFAIDDGFMLTVTQRVVNTGEAAVNLYPYSLISRRGRPETMGFFILHEGPLGVFNETLREYDYDDLQDAPQGVIAYQTTGGWIGITDKYWLTALVPEQDGPVTARFVHFRSGSTDVYQVDYLSDRGVTVAPGGSAEWTGRVFAGAKVARMLDAYAEAYGIPLFDRAIDFGWFYFLTKPLFQVLTFIQSYVHNFGVSIMILTVLIKLIFFPLANKSYKSMSQMRKLQPEMLKLRERFGDDRARLNQEMMALYKREKVNPASGCLPILIQIPVFFALYKVLFVTIEMRHAPFFGWIQDLSAPDPTTVFNLFGLIPWDPPQILMIGVWPLIMGVTMYLQQRLNPQPPDPLQAKIFMALPVVFTVMLAQFPAGLVVYWTWNNLLSIAQQWVIMRRMGVKP
jgi:YidC/Oxa1 family membrane protein insertase